MAVTLRTERPQEAEEIAQLIERAFRSAPHTNHQEQNIVAALRRDGALTLSLVAEQDGALCGYAAVSPVAISDGAQGWYGLGPVAVAPARQNRGIGARLIKALLQELAAMGGQGCVVLGEPSYYQRFGFRAAPQLVLADVPPHYFMALRLSGAMPAGEVRYHPAFMA